MYADAGEITVDGAISAPSSYVQFITYRATRGGNTIEGGPITLGSSVTARSYITLDARGAVNVPGLLQSTTSNVVIYARTGDYEHDIRLLGGVNAGYQAYVFNNWVSP